MIVLVNRYKRATKYLRLIMKYVIKNLNELSVLAEEFLIKLNKSEKQEKSTVVGLSGDLGSGKTAFTKCIGSILGIIDLRFSHPLLGAGWENRTPDTSLENWSYTI